MKASTILLLCLSFFVGILYADVQVPAIFSDHMVLQRNGAVPIWGKADPGEQVNVTAGSQRGVATADSTGNWMIRLENLVASSEPIQVVIEGRNKIVIQDVLVGDVWVCSGQSNMEFGIKNERTAAEEIPRAHYPQIRLFFVPKLPLPQPAADVVSPAPTQGRWLVCTSATVVQNGWGGFSAVGYFFGRDIHRFTGAPVGLIGTYWGGTPAQAWISQKGLSADPALKWFADQATDHALNFERKNQAYDEVLLPKWKTSWDEWKADNTPAWDTYQNAVRQWTEDRQIAEANGKPAPARPKDPSPSKPVRPAENPQLASVLFNGMIAPLIPYGIKGVIWYQGEANTGEAVKYAAFLTSLIKDWRTRWDRGDFPFLVVQLANYKQQQTEPTESNWAALRESQAKALALPNTALAVTIDSGEADDIHPKKKAIVGERLALAARKIAYGDDCVFSGPTFVKMSIEGTSARLAFQNIGSGLVVAPSSGSLKGFSIAGPDGKFHWADAHIEGNSVVVSSPEVPNPVHVRYAWADNPDCHLSNREGLPAVPFRTDDFPVGEYSRAR